MSANPTTRVLLVEGDGLVRSLITRLLRRRGLEVVEARDRRQAVEILTSDGPPIDGVILDIDKREPSVPAALEEIRRAAPTARLILTAAWGLDLPPGLTLLLKPYDAAELTLALQRAGL
ncbi:MAG: hypothetical protein JNL79_03540 [Myxococcales bacterium]|nr:hypothetical protein [Myxococcales bacterium]